MKESNFDGGILGYYGIIILCGLLSFCTLFIGLPWAIVIYQKWETKHTIIDGKRLIFDGTGIQLFGNYIKWWFLSLITFGIYGLWVKIKILQWIAKHTHFED
ncbi:DUF898 domain-containing protein [Streptobacillus notomytis]|uniref:DUF898 domain-containing protein n=1 Tax=Streptobacillus notomytis TaxID=1712031 RepID=UPI000A9D6C90|nr:DUF898 domain-containing protein [Streptobacillus notomytis]